MLSSHNLNVIDLNEIFDESPSLVSNSELDNATVSTLVKAFRVKPEYRAKVASVTMAIPALVDRELLNYGANYSPLKWEVHSSRELKALNKRDVLTLRGACHVTNKERHVSHKTVSSHLYVCVIWPKTSEEISDDTDAT